MSLYNPHSAASSSKSQLVGTTEFDILRSSHKFLRDDDEEGEPGKELSWEDQMAKKYYSSLYREFAVCDLKHYKSGNFALRWRTEEEVISGAGEETCGNTRCAYHDKTALSNDSRPDLGVKFSPSEKGSRPPSLLKPPKLVTLELPFAYEEFGETKNALVKVVLCERCTKKLMWKREKGKVVEPEGKRESWSKSVQEKGERGEAAVEENGFALDRRRESPDRNHEPESLKEKRGIEGGESSRQLTRDAERDRRHDERRRSSRSRSPRRGGGRSSRHDHHSRHR